MADTGFVIAGAGANVAAGGDASWISPGNITAEDASVSEVAFDFNGDFSDELQATSFYTNGLDIGSGSTVDGIEVRVKARESGSAIISSLRLVSGGSDVGVQKSPSQALTGTLTNYDFGGASDLWSWSPSDTNINTDTFGVKVEAEATDDDVSALVDAVWIKVYYTAASGGSGNLIWPII